MTTQATTSAQQAAAQLAAVTAAWLSRARRYYDVVQLGTVPAGAAGGGTSTVTWNRPVPEAPAWADALLIEYTLPIAVTIPAGGSVTVSPYAPYSGFQRQLNLGGANAIPYVSGVPFWLDEITNRRAFDPTVSVPEGLPAPWADPGSGPYTLNGLTPGAVISNTGTASITNNYTITWRERMTLGRNLVGRATPNLVGCIPLGDPDHRPVLNMYLGNLVGTHPEDSLFVAASGAGVTGAVGTGGASVSLVWEALSLDILPPGYPSLPSPQVVMGLAVETNGGQGIQNSGQIQNIPHRTAQLYHQTYHVLVNNQLPVDADYFGLWLTGEQQSARWEYDSNLGNLFAYYERVKRVYGRYLPEGVFVADYARGDMPDLPKESPYIGVMSPDVGYAALAGVAPTPAMQTAIRIPAGTTMSGAYVKTYSFGQVSVTY